MSSITGLLGNLYSLTGQQSGTSSGSTSAVNTLSDAMDAIADTVDESSNSQNAYAVSLSPEAQKYLNGAGSSNDSFVISPAQQRKIEEIIAKYKDAPFTQETFEAMQQELADAGLGSQQLTLMEKIKSFSPTSILLQALDGTSTPPEEQQATSDDALQAKANNYLESIVKQWQKISTTYEADKG